MMLKWLRDNYGWQAKKREWATLAFCLLISLTIFVVLAQT